MPRISLSDETGLLPQLRLSGSAVFEKDAEGVYVYETIATDQGIVATGSNCKVKFFDPSALQEVASIRHHTEQITQTRIRGNTLLTSSLDGTIAIWDLRQQSKKPTLGFTADSALLSFDLGLDERLLVGGSELNDNYRHASICFWDMRSGGAPAKSFTNIHSNDVSQIHCSKKTASLVLSASTDGLVCTLDAMQQNDENNGEEDDVLGYVMNTGASVAHCGFFGFDEQFIYAQSDMETLQLWSADATLLVDFGDMRESADSGVPLDYMAAFHYDDQTQRLFMAAGRDNGDLHVLHVGAGSLDYVQTLSGGHSAIVRSYNWAPQLGGVVTGGEDGRLCLWQPLES
ncbi:hypothetical protein GGI07_000499 [Coemansia sp. Benny D115]|nr:hypothetical protein GGI07_000499 [Coemansia sp. Benny D115]